MSNPSSKTLHLTSLGSSFGAGIGIPPYTLKSARRSSKNYSSLLAAHFSPHIKHTDLTVSGATLQNILDTPQVFFGNTFTPQIDGLNEDTDLLTITAGGNDLGYIGGMMADEVKESWLGWLMSFLLPATPKATPMTSETLADSFIAVLDAIHSRAPKARVILVSYLTLLGSDVKSGRDTNLSPEKIEHFRGVAEVLNRAYKMAVEARKGKMEVELLDVAGRSIDHGLGSKEPWVEGFTMGSMWRGRPCHPNDVGHRAIADMLIERLAGEMGS